MNSAAVTSGIANSVRNAVTSIIHTNGGIRSSVMPGARMFRIVTMKFSDAVIDPMPSITMPTAQKSGPCPGRYPADIGVLVSGVYPNQPPFGAPPSTKLEYRKIPPKRNTQ